MTWGADVVIANMDSWVLRPDAYRDVPYVARFPVDMQPLSAPIKEAIAPALVRIVESRFGEQMVRDAGLDCVYVPAAIDTKVFYPMERSEARQLLGWPQDKFIVGMVATNKGSSPSRKGFAQAMGGFAQFKRETAPDALLYLHCTKGSAGEYDGEDLPALAEMEGILPAVLFADQYKIVAGGFPDAYMRALYSAFDVLLCTSMGEGVCVPVVEAQACGTPVIAPSWTATNELVFSGWRLFENEPFPLPKFQAYQYTARRSEVAAKLTSAHRALGTPGVRQTYRAQAVAGAQRYDADYVAANDWPAALAQIAERLSVGADPVVPTPEQCAQCGISSTPPWAPLGWLDGQGALWSPCTHGACAHAQRTDLATRRHSFAPDAFPMEVAGVPLDIEDTPPGAVAKIVAREATASYHLDQLTFQPGDTVIDIGAHVGVMSLYLAKKWPDIRIIAVEPHPENYARLQRNIVANGVTNVHALNYAMSGDGRDLTLIGNYAANTGGMGICNPPTKDAYGITVQSLTLAELFTMFEVGRVALLKVDCEGAEYEILGQNPTLLDQVDRLVGEFHEGAHTPKAAALLAFVEQHIAHVDVGVCKV
jgi:FkbM family methyltransferase